MKKLFYLLVGVIMFSFSTNAFAELYSVSITPREARPGTQVIVSVSSDFIMKKLKLWAYSYTDGFVHDHYRKNFIFKYDKTTNTHESTFTIDKLSKTGKFILDGIVIEFPVNHLRMDLINGKHFNGNVFVTGNDPDTTAPKLTDISLSKKKVLPGESFTLRLKAEDDKSGIKKIWCWTDTKHQLNTDHTAFRLKFNKTTGYYEHTFKIDRSPFGPKFIIGGIVALDYIGNRVSYQHSRDFNGAIDIGN